MTTDTPRTDACPHCGAESIGRYYKCQTPVDKPQWQTLLCKTRCELTASKDEVERLRGLCERVINALTHTADPMNDEPKKLRAELLGISE
jgi:hypothetical protein